VIGGRLAGWLVGGYAQLRKAEFPPTQRARRRGFVPTGPLLQIAAKKSTRRQSTLGIHTVPALVGQG
jgi:hypothetical protein